MSDHDPTRDPPEPRPVLPLTGVVRVGPGDLVNRTPDAPLAGPQLAGRVAATTPRSAAGAGAVPGYELLGKLGRGGMAIVHRALDTRLNREVAIKMTLRADADCLAVARFWAEAEVMAAVKHPHVVRALLKAVTEDLLQPGLHVVAIYNDIATLDDAREPVDSLSVIHLGEHLERMTSQDHPSSRSKEVISADPAVISSEEAFVAVGLLGKSIL